MKPTGPLSEADVAAANKFAASDAIKKFLRGSTLVFADACRFWGITASTANPIAKADSASDRLVRIVNSFGEEPIDRRLPPLSTCYGVLSLSRLMRGRFERELTALAENRRS